MTNRKMNTCTRLFTLCLMILSCNAALFGQGKPVTDVKVVNTPEVNVASMPAINITNTPDVNITNTPDVTITNTQGNPVAVSIVNGAVANPALPGSPLFAFKNAEGGSPILFGPFDANTKIAVGSLSFDGGNATFGTQLWLYVTNCQAPASVLHTVGAYMVANNRAGQGPQHMIFPVPIVLPLQPTAQTWCFQASPVTADQILITAVGYVIE